MEVNKIIQGDCLEVLKGFPDESIDLTVTSPPYDNIREYKGYVFNFEKLAKELLRVTKDGGVVVWVVGDQTINGDESGTSFKQALYFKEIGFRLHDTMIYEKNSISFPEVNRYYQSFEYMFVFSKGLPLHVNLLRDRKNKYQGSWTSASERQTDGSLKKSKKIICEDYGVRFNFWKYNTGHGFSTKDIIAYEHPAIFPELLAADHIKSWSNEGDLVLDPMCGSGTTCKMAQHLGRDFIGIDVCEDYCNIARERTKQTLLV